MTETLLTAIGVHLLIGLLCAFIGIRLSAWPNRSREERAWTIALSLYSLCWLALLMATRIKEVL